MRYGFIFGVKWTSGISHQHITSSSWLPYRRRRRLRLHNLSSLASSEFYVRLLNWKTERNWDPDDRSFYFKRSKQPSTYSNALPWTGGMLKVVTSSCVFCPCPHFKRCFLSFWHLYITPLTTLGWELLVRFSSSVTATKVKIAVVGNNLYISCTRNIFR